MVSPSKEHKYTGIQGLEQHIYLCTRQHVYTLSKNTPRPWWGRQACRGTTSISRRSGTLCDWLTPIHAVTGIPVTVYSLQVTSPTGRCAADVTYKFLRQILQTTSALFPCGCFHHGFNRSPASFS